MDPLGSDGSGDGDVERRDAGRSRGRGTWAPMAVNTQEMQILRRPHHAVSGAQTAGSTETRNTEKDKSDKCPDDIIKNSTLSVHAAEFIPKSYPAEQPMQHSQQRQPQHQAQMRMAHKSVQDRLVYAREMPNHVPVMQQEYYAHNYDNSQQYQQSDPAQQFENYMQQQEADQRESSGDEDNFMLKFANTKQQLLNVIRSLILNPGRFSVLSVSLIKSLRPYLEFPSQFREIIGIIIQQSINEGNFRYSGARLCASLDTSLRSYEQTTFRELLYDLCKEETENQSSTWPQKNDHTDDEQKKCHGLILFLAELVTQMEATCALGLGELLVQLITVVLKKPAPNSVKHICQALKLAGHTLERDKTGSRKDMENMMRALTELVTAGRVDSHVGRMVHSVHELRNGNWGQTTSAVESPTIDTVQTESLQSLDEPVLYGPDGKVLSAEENKFLEDHADSASNIDNNRLTEQDYEDAEKWGFEDEDDGYDAAYEEFLKLIPQIKNKTQK